VVNVGLTVSQMRQLTQVWPTAWTPTMPGVRARRSRGTWAPSPAADASAAVEL
jgi:hypothetical protein